MFFNMSVPKFHKLHFDHLLRKLFEINKNMKNYW